MQDETMVKDVMEGYENDLKKAHEHLLNEYQVIRAGRANPHILDRVMVDYYGAMTPLNQMANIQVQEARVLAINVWDQSQLKNVEKAIQLADLGVQPTDDGKTIRLIFPALTEERRREIVKQVKKLCEDTKVAMRGARRDCLDIYKQMKKDNMLSEDEYNNLEDDVQKRQDRYIELCDKSSDAKEKEVMEI